MVETIATSYVQRIQYILLKKQITKGELAKMVKVSSKTMSLWLTRKSYPREQHLFRINKMYEELIEAEEAAKKVKDSGKNAEGKKVDEKVMKGKNWKAEDITQKVVKGILYEQEQKELKAEERAEESAERDERVSKEGYVQYFNGKKIALSLEEKNNNKIILFPSSSEYRDLEGERKKEWYKLGGNSALFYRYCIGPRMGRRDVKIRLDEDYKYRFKKGLAAIHFLERFNDEMEKLGMKGREIEYGLVIYELDKVFSEKEIEEMKNLEREDKEKVKSLIMPKENFPDIYKHLREMSLILLPKLKRIKQNARDFFSEELTRILAGMYKDYFRMANGVISKLEARERILGGAEDMKALLAIADENNYFPLTTRARLGLELYEIKKTVELRLKEDKEEK